MHGGATAQAHYHVAYDSATDRVYANAASDEEIAHPYTPHGINTYLNLFGGSIPLSAPQRTFDYLGVPELAPNYSFGVAPYAAQSAQTDDGMRLVAQIRREFGDSPARVPAPRAENSTLKTIAAVEVVRRRYVITFDGMNDIAGHADYHLSLKPVANPNRYRLRELWVNYGTFATDRLVTQGNFTAPQLSGVKWTVDFTQIDGAAYIASERAQTGFVLDRRAYDQASIAFTDIKARAISPLQTWGNFLVHSGEVPETLVEPPEDDGAITPH